MEIEGYFIMCINTYEFVVTYILIRKLQLVRVTKHFLGIYNNS